MNTATIGHVKALQIATALLQANMQSELEYAFSKAIEEQKIWISVLEDASDKERTNIGRLRFNATIHEERYVLQFLETELYIIQLDNYVSKGLTK